MNQTIEFYDKDGNIVEPLEPKGTTFTVPEGAVNMKIASSDPSKPVDFLKCIGGMRFQLSEKPLNRRVTPITTQKGVERWVKDYKAANPRATNREVRRAIKRQLGVNIKF